MDDNIMDSAADQACSLFSTLFAESMAIGRKPNGGTDRMALTPDDCAHRNWLAEKLEKQGAQVSVDGAGNIFGLHTWVEGAPYLIVGSHLDSQENGGVYDGAYGVVAAIAVAKTLDDLVRRGSLKPRINLAVVDWTNEEGARFEPSLMGSRFYTGALSFESIAKAEDLDGTRFEDALAASGWLGKAKGPEAAGYLEAHVEQGPELKQRETAIGAVVGNWSAVKLDVRIDGEQAHTGSTPMPARRDAFLGLAHLTVAASTLSQESPFELRTSVTKVRLFPHSPNIVTAQAFAHMELRAERLEDAMAAHAALEREMQRIEKESRVTIAITNVETRQAMSFPESGVSAIEAAAHRAGLTSMRLKTVCGHDAIAMASCVPTALLFVPSEGSKAHAPSECTCQEDLEAGVATLLHLAAEVVERGELG